MVALERLDEGGLGELVARTDAVGVVSVYLNADPRHDPGLRAAGIDLKNRFRELQQRVAAEPGSESVRARAAALEACWPRIESLADPAASGRGRIVFTALDDDWSVRLESALPVASRVVLDDGPFIHPLLELLDEGRPAGVVLISGDHARLLEWRVGKLRQLSSIDQQYVEAAHERAGQIGGGPQGQFNSPVREQRQARGRERTERFVDQVVTVATGLAETRGWQRLLVSGGDRWTEPTVAGFAHRLRDKIFIDSRVLAGLDDSALADAVSEWAHRHHAEQERKLLVAVGDAAGSGRAAVGLSEVAAALNAGRIEHLVYDPAVRYAGYIGADSALYGGEEVGPDGRPGTPEPRLTERLVERALASGARISPVDGAAAGALRHVAGIAGLLRW